MEIVRLVEEKVLSLAVKVLGVLEEEISFQGFESTLKQELDGLGCEILKLVLEELDTVLKADKTRQEEWVVERKGDLKSLLTPFGTVSYRLYILPSQTEQAVPLPSRPESGDRSPQPGQ